MPSKPGFLDNNWKDRDLNTNTKQLNFDLTKDFSIKETYHSLSYGGIYGTTEKSMVNRQGYGGTNKQW